MLRFAQAVEMGNFEAARADLRVPPGGPGEAGQPEALTAEEIDAFLREVQSDRHVSVEGARAVLQLGFGSLEERFEELADVVAVNASLVPTSSYAFGGPSASAVLSWDGKRFWIVAVYNLADLAESPEPEDGEEPELAEKTGGPGELDE